MSEQLLTIHGLSESIGVPVRTIQEWQKHRKIPYLKMGHRTILYSAPRVLAAIQKFEVKAVA